MMSANNRNNHELITSTGDSQLQTIKDLQRLILQNEPQSCQNQNLREKPMMLLKNFQSTQRTSNSQVATPKHLKFKQQIKSNKNVNNFLQPNIQSCNVPIKKQETAQNQDSQTRQATNTQDTSTSKSPLNKKQAVNSSSSNQPQSFILNKVYLKTSSQKSRDCNLSQITATNYHLPNNHTQTQQIQSCHQDNSQSYAVMSSEKQKALNKSGEEELRSAAEMSTTLNLTQQNIESVTSQVQNSMIFTNQICSNNSLITHLNCFQDDQANPQPSSQGNNNSNINYYQQQNQKSKMPSTNTNNSFLRANSQKTKPTITSRKPQSSGYSQYGTNALGVGTNGLELHSPTSNLNTTQQINKSYLSSNSNGRYPSNNSQKLQSKGTQQRSESYKHQANSNQQNQQQNLNIEIKRSEIVKLSQPSSFLSHNTYHQQQQSHQMAHLHNQHLHLMPMSTQTKQSKQFIFNQTQGPSKLKSKNSVIQSQKSLNNKKSSTRSSRSNSIKKDPMYIQVNNQNNHGQSGNQQSGADQGVIVANTKKRHSEATKRFIKHQVLKNNFVNSKLDNSNAYDGDVSSVVIQQQKKRKIGNNNNIQGGGSLIDVNSKIILANPNLGAISTGQSRGLSSQAKVCHTLEEAMDEEYCMLNAGNLAPRQNRQMILSNQDLMVTKSGGNINEKIISSTDELFQLEDIEKIDPNLRTQQINFHQYGTFNIRTQDDEFTDIGSNQHLPEVHIYKSNHQLQERNIEQEFDEDEDVHINFDKALEIEQMRKELRNKDMLIQNLKERLNNLEEKVNSIHKEEQRDRSQQRIKEAIANLEQKLMIFHQEREENKLKLQEIKTISSSLHSSSRQSEEQKAIIKEKRKFQQCQQNQRSQYIQMELEELESLITIVDGDDFLLQKSIKTPVFEDLDKVVGEVEDDLNIIAIQADGDLLSEGQQDNSCLMMLEKEWQEQQQQMMLQQQDQSMINSNNHDNSSIMILGGLLDQSKNIVFYPNEDCGVNSSLEEDDDQKLIMGLDKGSKEKFIKTQQIQFSSQDKSGLVDFIMDIKRSNQDAHDICQSKDDILSTQGKEQLKSTLHKRKASFSKTMSKSTLLNKIRQALNKQGELQPRYKDSGMTLNNVLGGCDQKKTPRRFIIKRSQERNNQQQNPNINIANQCLKENQNLMPDALSQHTFNPLPPAQHFQKQKPQISLKNIENPNQQAHLKQKIQMIKQLQQQQQQQQLQNVQVNGQCGKITQGSNNNASLNTRVNPKNPIDIKSNQHSSKDNASRLNPTSNMVSNIMHPQQQQHDEHLLKTMINQKERVASNQKEALKRERELSLKLRQAIQKMNFKMQIQNKQKMQIAQVQGSNTQNNGMCQNQNQINKEKGTTNE